MRLLPEFRKASKQMDKVHFGTVDCTIHTNLCNQVGFTILHTLDLHLITHYIVLVLSCVNSPSFQYQVQSYPTTVLYNQTVPHRFHGHHHVRDIVEFLQVIFSALCPQLSLIWLNFH